ncbi:MAG TPA: hypothetical protein VJN71_11195, partial [Nitrososphaerales archaeon]|nr:hypothetical protein [Nitrososphaerales archaeon]
VPPLVAIVKIELEAHSPGRDCAEATPEGETNEKRLVEVSRNSSTTTNCFILKNSMVGHPVRVIKNFLATYFGTSLSCEIGKEKIGKDNLFRSILLSQKFRCVFSE